MTPIDINHWGPQLAPLAEAGAVRPALALGAGSETLLVLLAAGLTCVLLGMGVMHLLHRKSTGDAGPQLTPIEPVVPVPTSTPQLREAIALSRICAAFEVWLRELPQLTDPWGAFDQLLRETLSEHVGATRVRCYRIVPGSDTLHSIAQTPTPGPSAREGLLGHVATTGREFFINDPSSGPLLRDLAGQTDDQWTWVLPMREDGSVTGIVALGHVQDPLRLDDDLRQTIGPLVRLGWELVASQAELQQRRQTDPATGVMTRSDFFAHASEAVHDSYANNEPLVLAVLSLEGLRRLDDAGNWSTRDQLIEALGETLRQRARSDDLVGRFADDRFIILLRRLDSGLGRLIAGKLLTAANECAAQLVSDDQTVRMRIGLAGSGFDQFALDELLIKAFDAVERARRDDLPIGTDLCPGEQEQNNG